jgi:NAD(P)H-hydrate repair Nnr-like enzyme with NAD(P)H-hydrate epimerase domain
LEFRQGGRRIFGEASAWSATEAIAFDQHLQRELGLAAPLLMENAGAALAQEALQMLAEQGLPRIVLFCGPGNNGGDALVAARHLAGAGPEVEIRLPLALDPARAAAVDRWLVDGLFGLGLSRPLEGAARAAVQLLNGSGSPILAADLPSGLDADRGVALGLAVRATRTLTFVAPKRGMTVGLGPECCGEVRVADIGVHAAYAAAWLGARRAGATGGS